MVCWLWPYTIFKYESWSFSGLYEMNIAEIIGIDDSNKDVAPLVKIVAKDNNLYASVKFKRYKWVHTNKRRNRSKVFYFKIESWR